MNSTLLKALAILVVVGVLFIWSLKLFRSTKRKAIFIQLTGSVFLVIVSIVHIFEAEHWFEFMHWGSPHSVGHYIDLLSAILGIILFLLGFMSSKLSRNEQ